VELVWLIPALPLLSFLLLIPFGRTLGDPGSGWIATLLAGSSFAVTLAIYLEVLSRPAESQVIHKTLFTWIPAGDFSVDIGFLADPLSLTMCLFITGIGTLIHLYSIGYMKGDHDYPKFFTYLSLFVASMLVLVLADNLLLTFLGWEGVGACSYLLISFWFSDKANASAGKKAFVTNRIGDFGFMVGTFLLWLTIGTINYADIPERLGGMSELVATAIVLLFFLGATGKSAQLPLFVWLPDAMAGPTPVSALIHAATMVTSGIFLLTRLEPLLFEAPVAAEVIAWVGLATALVAALAAVGQNDIKKVLAYSTVSQLGYMFLAIGSGAFVAATYHMVTHAFFKALMFLGSGSVIAAMSHEQDMRLYGRLRKYLPITSITFILGWLAIAGIPPFSGFWSKDEILAAAWDAEHLGAVKWAIGVVVALLTAFYMTRLVVMTFFGPKENWRDEETLARVTAAEGHHAEESLEDASHADDDHHAHHLDVHHEPKESHWTMTVPLVVLAVAATISGILNLPFTESTKRLEHWLEPVLSHHHEPLDATTLYVLAGVAIAAATTGILAAYFVYQKQKVDSQKIEKPAFAHALYIDESYAALIGGPGTAAFQGVADFDAKVVDGAVNGVAKVTESAGQKMRPAQSGLVRTYALGLSVGAVLLLGYVVMRMSI
jgi:NADH-quinone oxidoreductase subunit L